MDSIENLTREQTHNVLRFLLHRMGGDTRRALMAELPVAYARLYPTVNPDVVVAKVSKAISLAHE